MNSVNSLKVSNELGPIDQRNGFLPFGPVVVIGSYLDIEFGGIIAVKPTEIFLTLVWQELPDSFDIYFQNYQTENTIGNSYFYVDFYLNSGKAI